MTQIGNFVKLERRVVARRQNTTIAPDHANRRPACISSGRGIFSRSAKTRFRAQDMTQHPTNPKAEIATALIKGVLAEIPFVGGMISEVGNLYLNPLEKRKQKWLDDVSLAIGEPRGRGASGSDRFRISCGENSKSV